MVTAIQKNTQQDNEINDDRFEAEENVQELSEGEVVIEAALEDAQASAAEIGVTAELLLHPFNTPVQAIWLCETLKKELDAEVLYLQGSPNGTVIKVRMPKSVPLPDFLSGMAEVAEAWEERAPQKTRGGDPLVGLTAARLSQPDSTSRDPEKIVCVAMKPQTFPSGRDLQEATLPA